MSMAIEKFLSEPILLPSNEEEPFRKKTKRAAKDNLFTETESSVSRLQAQVHTLEESNSTLSEKVAKLETSVNALCQVVSTILNNQTTELGETVRSEAIAQLSVCSTVSNRGLDQLKHENRIKGANLQFKHAREVLLTEQQKLLRESRGSEESKSLIFDQLKEFDRAKDPNQILSLIDKQQKEIKAKASATQPDENSNGRKRRRKA